MDQQLTPGVAQCGANQLDGDGPRAPDLIWSIGWERQPVRGRVFELLKVAALLVGVRLGLIVFGFERTAKAVNRLSHPVERRHGIEHVDLRAAAYVVGLAAAVVPARILCLERSLVLYYTLRRRGVPVGLRLGVRALPFASHAWVELKGCAINEASDHMKDFDPIFELV
jgi:hypothetical protein